MPSILVVEHEGRYIERIQDALSAEGWRPRFVAGRPEALRAAASEAPHLVLVNAELPGAAELLRSFARSHGGPGAVAMLGEGGESGDLDADELLSKPFSDQELRLVVRRRLAAAENAESVPPAPARPADAGGADDDHKLTSQEIFGDLLAEVENEAGGGDGATAEPPTDRAPAAARLRDEDVEQRLERTLSGVPGLGRRHRAAQRHASGAPEKDPQAPHREPPQGPDRDGPERREPPPRAPVEPPRRDPPPGRPPQGDPSPRAERSLRPADDDVDELLNMTLSGLDLGRSGRRRPAPPSPPPAASKTRPARQRAAEIDLSELEAMAARSRRRSSRSGSPGADAAGEAPAHAVAPASEGAAIPSGDEPPEAVATPTAGGGEPAAATTAEPTPSAAVPEPSAAVPAPTAEAAAPTAAEPPAPDAVVEPAPAEPDGRRFGHYRLLERIAVGGMAEVWKARMSGVEGFQKTVAIKRILPHMNDDSDFVDMFIDEAKLAAQLNHPNITHIYDLGKIDDDYYIAMEYVDGRNLRAILNESRRKALKLPVGFAVLVAARLASALDYAHRKRDFDERDLELVHRDVSPQNVLISTDGDIKLCDFGISKAVAKLSQTETGALKGKLQYMSPEQAWGRRVDARSDLFSLGALSFEMLTGERLFTGDSEISVLEAVRDCRVRGPRQVEPSVPEAVERVVLKALERDPADRYASAGEMLQALEEVLYQLRPTPGQGDVAAFLARLEAAPEVRPGGPADATGTGTGTGTGRGSSPATGPGEAVDLSGRDAEAEAVAGSPGLRPPAAAATPAPPVPAAAADPRPPGGRARDATGTTGTGTGRGNGAGAPLPSPPAGPDPGRPAPPLDVLPVIDEAAEPAGSPAATGAAASGAGAPTIPASPTAGARGGRRWWPFGAGPGATTGAPGPSAPERGSNAGAKGKESGGDAASAADDDPRDASHAGGRGEERSAVPLAATGGAVPSPPEPARERVRRSPPAPAAAGSSAADSTATGSWPAAQHRAIAGRDEPDEDAARGRWLLVVAILLLAVVSVAVWLWLERPAGGTGDAEPSVDEVAQPAAATPPAVPGPPAAGDEAGEAAAPAAPPEIDLERLVEEELARQQEEVRRQAEAEYRERARRIQAQIDALGRAREADPPAPPDTEPPPEEGETTPPPPPGTAGESGALAPPDASAAGLPAALADRLVTSRQPQYPAGAPTPADRGDGLHRHGASWTSTEARA